MSHRTARTLTRRSVAALGLTAAGGLFAPSAREGRG